MLIGKDQMETALREVPFTIKMADGREYRVDDARQVFLSGTHVLYVDKNALPHMLPWMTISGISFGNVRRGGKKGQGK
jgi:hypothetical protein